MTQMMILAEGGLPRDPVSHGTGTDDGDALDLHLACPPVRASGRMI